jgi:hypothetical protein
VTRVAARRLNSGGTAIEGKKWQQVAWRRRWRMVTIAATVANGDDPPNERRFASSQIKDTNMAQKNRTYKEGSFERAMEENGEREELDE